jgi:hypothetical protein
MIVFCESHAEMGWSERTTRRQTESTMKPMCTALDGINECQPHRPRAIARMLRKHAALLRLSHAYVQSVA